MQRGAAVAQKIDSSPVSADNSWRNTLSSAAMGVAGAATAVGLSALAFYAYHKLGADASLIVDQSTLHGIGMRGAEHVEAAVSGLRQIDSFMSSLSPRSGEALTMGDFFAEMQRTGVEPAIFKGAVAQHAIMVGSSNGASWQERLSNPETMLSVSVRARVAEVVWFHDKKVALNAQSANDAVVFAKAGFATGAAMVTSSLYTGVDRFKEFMGHIGAAVRRTALDNGLIDVADDRKLRQAIKETAYDPSEARARVASEYAERCQPLQRFFTAHWMEALREADRPCMLKLFGLESSLTGKYSSVGQAVMIDHFSSRELKDLQRDEPDHALALGGLAERRGKLEERGTKPKESVNSLGELFSELPLRSIAELIQEHVEQERKKHSSLTMT